MYEHSPLLQAVMHNTEAYADKTAIIMNGQEVSYSALGKIFARRPMSFNT